MKQSLFRIVFPVDIEVSFNCCQYSCVRAIGSRPKLRFALSHSGSKGSNTMI